MNASFACEAVNDLCMDEIEAIEERLQHHLRGRVRHLRLFIVPGGLILRGRASTYYAKQLAQQAVLEATVIPIVANEIDVP